MISNFTSQISITKEIQSANNHCLTVKLPLRMLDVTWTHLYSPQFLDIESVLFQSAHLERFAWVKVIYDLKFSTITSIYMHVHAYVEIGKTKVQQNQKRCILVIKYIFIHMRLETVLVYGYSTIMGDIYKIKFIILMAKSQLQAKGTSSPWNLSRIYCKSCRDRSCGHEPFVINRLFGQDYQPIETWNRLYKGTVHHVDIFDQNWLNRNSKAKTSSTHRSTSSQCCIGKWSRYPVSGPCG